VLEILLVIAALLTPTQKPNFDGMKGLFSRAATLAAVATLLLLAGCAFAPLPVSVPISAQAAQNGVTLQRSLPQVLPDKAVPIPHSQFVLIPSESAAGLLVPIPFVSGAIGAVMDRHTAETFEASYGQISPYNIALAEMRTSPFFRATGGVLQLQPFAFLTECVDDKYRLALVFLLEGGGWTGRYMYHLPTAYDVAEFKAPSPQLLATIRTEFVAGAQVLRQLLERAAQGRLESRGIKAELGSLHLVGGKAAGLLSPTLLVSKEADVLEETDEHVVVRMPGEMANAGTTGGLFFGVHYFRKSQLHTFKKL
jgi:hypothetical protein